MSESRPTLSAVFLCQGGFMTNLKIGVQWCVEDRQLDKRLLPLLRAISVTGSLNQAVKTLRMSYRHTWGLLGRMERFLGGPLVSRHRGRGVRLTCLGEKLIAADDEAIERLNHGFDEILQNLDGEPRKYQPGIACCKASP